MWPITRQMMHKNLRMLIPAGIAVLIGTAFIAATLLFSNAVGRAMRDQVTAQYGGANYVLTVDGTSPQADDATATTYGELDVPAIERVDGVQAVRPDIMGAAVITGSERNMTGAVIATAQDPAMLPVTIAEGVAPDPEGQGEIAIPASLADDWNVRVGDRLHVDSQANASGTVEHDPIDVRVVGLTEDPSGAYNYYGGASVVSDDVLVALAGATSMDEMNVTSLYLLLDDAKAASAQQAIKALAPAGFTVGSRASMAQQAVEAMGNDTDVTRNFLLAFGILALVVAALVIANTFQVLVAQRRRTLALLRTIGATQRQLYASVLQEATLLGLVASVLGVGAGIGLMALVARSGVSTGNLGSIHLVFTWPVFVVPVLFGTAMTLLASMGAARMATGVAPLEAMRPLELTDQRKSRIGRAVIGLLCLLAGVGLVALALSGNDDTSDLSLLSAAGGCALAFLGAALTALFWMPWLMRGAGALAALCGPSGTLADANIRKNPRRVAATGTALLIGVTLISTLATGATDAKATMGQALDTRYSVDVVVTGGDVPRQAADQAARVDGVEHSLYAPVALGRFTDANGQDITVQIIGVPDGEALQSVLNVDLGNVTLGTGDVVMQRYETNFGEELAFKDTVDLTEVSVGDDGTATDQGHADLHVVQRDLRRVSDEQATAFVNESLFDDGTFTVQGHMLLMKVDTDSHVLSQTVEGIMRAFESDPGVLVGGPVMERQTWESMVDVLLTLLVALLAVAVVIAVIGVANTLSLSVIERTRESATLRAIGMTRGQLRASLCIEAVIIAVVSSVVGMLLGTLFGWVGITIVMRSIADVVYAVDWGTYGITLLLAVACALLASIFPARRAVRTAPVEALAEA